MRLERDATGCGHPFCLWCVPGKKRAFHDGNRIRIACSSSTDTFRVSTSLAFSEGESCAFMVSAHDDIDAQWDIISALMRLLGQKSREADRARKSLYPTREAIVQMRTLQALDGALLGASHRAIAAALFGYKEGVLRWHADGDVRARVRHLVRRGRAFMDGGYRALLTSSP